MAGRPPLLCRRATSTSRATGCATTSAADPGAFLGQAGAGHPPALAGTADHVGRRDPHLVEEHFVEVGRARHLAQRPHVDTGSAHVEDEGRNPGRAVDRLGPRQQIAVVGPLGPRAPDLLAHDHVVATVALGSSLERGEVAPGIGLAEELGPDVVASCHRRQVLGPLLVGAEMLECPGHEGIAEHMRDPDRAELLCQDALLVRIARLGRESGNDVVGVVNRPDIVPEQLDIVGSVGHPQACPLFRLQNRLVVGEQATERDPIAVVALRDRRNGHIHGLMPPRSAARRPRPNGPGARDATPRPRTGPG